MKPSFDLASGNLEFNAAEWLSLELPTKDGRTQKALIFIVGRPEADNVVICSAADPTDVFEQSNYAAVLVENPSNLAIDAVGIMDLICQNKQAEQAEATAQKKRVEFRQQLESNMRIIRFSLPGMQGKVSATAYVFGTVSEPRQVALEGTTSDFLRDPGQEFAEYTHMDEADQKLRARRLAEEASGNLAVVFVDEIQALATTQDAAIFDALQRNMTQKTVAPSPQGKGLLQRLLSLRFGG